MREPSRWIPGVPRWLLQGLAALGQMAGYALPTDGPGPECPPAGADPAPGHPERLRPDLPLSPVERRLSRELRRAPGRGKGRPEPR
ncbi:DUF6059 family protein [Kitasatospora sp. NPDC056783]|uniref:DUF6059 family protein n=1 Tax=Kitasatospora sp. NPDC056783 TaxID=3345943 RepID=UPI0036856C6A